MVRAISRMSSAVMASTSSLFSLPVLIFPYARSPLPMDRHWVSPLSLLMASWPSSCFFAALRRRSDISSSWSRFSSLSMALIHFSRLFLSHPRLMATMPVSAYCVYPHSTPYTHPFFSRRMELSMELLAGPPNMLHSRTVASLSRS